MSGPSTPSASGPSASGPSVSGPSVSGPSTSGPSTPSASGPSASGPSASAASMVTLSDDAMNTRSATNEGILDDTALSSANQVATNDTAVVGKTCRKCKKLKDPAEFLSKKTGRPTVRCQTCLAPKQQIVSACDSPEKRKVQASWKAVDNAEIDEQLEERLVSSRVKAREKKAVRQDSVAAKEAIQKEFREPLG